MISDGSIGRWARFVYSHRRFLRHVPATAPNLGGLNTPAIQLHASDDEHDFAFRRMCLIVCKQFASSAATELFEFLRQLTCNAQLPARHDGTAGVKRFKKPVRRFKKKHRLLAFGCYPQFALASAAFHRKKSAERKFLGRKSGTEQSGDNRRWSRKNRKWQ